MKKVKFDKLKVGDVFFDRLGRKSCKIEEMQIGGLICNYYVLDFVNVDDLVLSYATSGENVEKKDEQVPNQSDE